MSLCPLGRGKFWPHGFSLTNIDTGPPDNVSCQISNLLLSRIQNNIFSKKKINDTNVSILTPGL
jgi:hypothetical protein